MPEFPQYDENGEEILSFPNIWRNIDPQEISGVDCFVPFAPINNGLNRFVMDINGIDFRKMLSALYLGAEIAYPQEFMQIVLNFLKMVHCPIDFEEECQEYPTYTPIIQYAPMSPFINPDEVPDGYLVPPFVFVSEENIAEYGDYEIGDVIVPIDAITLDLDWFETLDGQLPTITINVEGEGKISMKLLTVPFGGVAIITLDNPPDLLDILAGIITGSDNILDVNRDIVSVPPETTEHVSYEIEVMGAGMHTVYIVFLPVLDDSLIPIRFGGGLRSIELCEFGELPDMGVTDVKWDDSEFMLMQQKLGVYYPVTDFQLFLDYIAGVDLKADNALLDAANAQASATNALEVGDINAADIDAVEVRLDIVEALQATHDTSIANLATRMDAAEGDIDDLDARLTALENADSTMWNVHYDFKASESGFGGGSGVSWASTVGYSWSTSPIVIAKTDSSFLDGRIAFYRLELRKSGAGEQDYTVKVVGDIYSYGVAESGLNIRYHKLQSMSGREDLEIQFAAAGSWVLEGLTIFGYGDSNAYDD
jgi:hypothetical protein